MGKNWLIRTRSNHILGPVSKEKVVELYSNGSVKPDDEVCSGNGFWFFLRETDMVERFLTGDEVQAFNPISEAKDVLTSLGPYTKERTSDDITLVGSLNLSSLKNQTPESAPKESVNEELVEENEPAHKDEPVAAPEPKKKINTETPVKLSATKLKKQPPKQDYLKYLMVLGFLVLLFLIYFRKTIMNSFFRDIQITSISLFSEAIAQEDLPQDASPAKKKNSLNAK